MNSNFAHSESAISLKRIIQKEHSDEDKIRIVIEGIFGDISVKQICEKEGINTDLFYEWSKYFMETNYIRFTSDAKSRASLINVDQLKSQNMFLRRLVADLSRENNLLKNKLNKAC